MFKILAYPTSSETSFVSKGIHTFPGGLPLPSDRVGDTTRYSRIQREMARAVVAIIPKSNVIQNQTGSWQMTGRTLLEVAKKQLNIPQDQSIGVDKSIPHFDPENRCIANATGFLVRPNIVITLRHCIPDDLDSIYITPDFDNYDALGPDSIYRVTDIKIISDTIPIDGRDEQWVLLFLDRDTPHFGLRLAATSQIPSDIYMHGHPFGQKKAIADCGKVATSGPTVFSALISGFLGNSGSPMFNRDHEVIGIFAAGPLDFKIDSNQISLKKFGPGDIRQPSTHEMCLLLTQEIVDTINKIAPDPFKSDDTETPSGSIFSKMSIQDLLDAIETRVKPLTHPLSHEATQMVMDESIILSETIQKHDLPVGRLMQSQSRQALEKKVGIGLRLLYFGKNKIAGSFFNFLQALTPDSVDFSHLKKAITTKLEHVNGTHSDPILTLSEKRYVESEIEAYRVSLVDIEKEIKGHLHTITRPKDYEALRSAENGLSDALKHFIKLTIAHCGDLLGPPPCSFAIMASGASGNSFLCLPPKHYQLSVVLEIKNTESDRYFEYFLQLLLNRLSKLNDLFHLPIVDPPPSMRLEPLIVTPLPLHAPDPSQNNRFGSPVYLGGALPLYRHYIHRLNTNETFEDLKKGLIDHHTVLKSSCDTIDAALAALPTWENYLANTVRCIVMSPRFKTTGLQDLPFEDQLHGIKDTMPLFVASLTRLKSLIYMFRLGNLVDLSLLKGGYQTVVLPIHTLLSANSEFSMDDPLFGFMDFVLDKGSKTGSDLDTVTIDTVTHVSIRDAVSVLVRGLGLARPDVLAPSTRLSSRIHTLFNRLPIAARDHLINESHHDPVLNHHLFLPAGYANRLDKTIKNWQGFLMRLGHWPTHDTNPIHDDFVEIGSEMGSDHHNDSEDDAFVEIHAKNDTDHDIRATVDYVEVTSGNFIVNPGLRSKSDFNNAVHSDRKSNAYGHSIVTQVSAGGTDLYIKQRPEWPGMDHAFNIFSHLLTGDGPQSSFVIVNGMPLLISKAVPGISLRDALLKAPNLKLDPQNYSFQFILALLTNPEDGHSTNYIVNNRRIVSIDNDRTFVGDTEGFFVSNPLVKTMLFCFDQMKDPLHDTVKTILLQIDPAQFLGRWLDEMIHYNTQLVTQERNGILSDIKNRKENQTLAIFSLNRDRFLQIYTTFWKLKKLVEGPDPVTHLQLLKGTKPELGQFYERALSDLSLITIESRFQRISDGFLKQNGDTWTSTKTHDELTRSRTGRTSTEISFDKAEPYSPEALRLFLDNKTNIDQARRSIFSGNTQPFSELSPRCKEKLLEKLDFSKLGADKQRNLLKTIEEHRTELTQLVIKNCGVLNEFVYRGNSGPLHNTLTHIDFSGSPITTVQINQIAIAAPNLQTLVLRNCNYLVDFRRDIPGSPFFNTLEKLTLSGSTRLESIQIWRMLKLHTLVLDGCVGLKNVKYKQDPQQALMDLSYIAPAIFPRQTPTIGNQSALKLGQLDVSFLKVEICLKVIEDLFVNGDRHETQNNVQKLRQLYQSDTNTNVLLSSLAQSSPVSFERILAVIHRGLQHLDLSSFQLRAEQLFKILLKAPNLRSLIPKEGMSQAVTAYIFSQPRPIKEIRLVLALPKGAIKTLDLNGQTLPMSTLVEICNAQPQLETVNLVGTNYHSYQIVDLITMTLNGCRLMVDDEVCQETLQLLLGQNSDSRSFLKLGVQVQTALKLTLFTEADEVDHRLDSALAALLTECTALQSLSLDIKGAMGPLTLAAMTRLRTLVDLDTGDTQLTIDMLSKIVYQLPDIRMSIANSGIPISQIVDPETNLLSRGFKFRQFDALTIDKIVADHIQRDHLLPENIAILLDERTTELTLHAPLTDDALSLIAQHCQALTSLTLYHAERLSSEGLGRLASLSSLQQLTLGGIAFNGSLHISNPLQELTLCYPASTHLQLQAKSLTVTLNQLENLTHLSLQLDQTTALNLDTLPHLEDARIQSRTLTALEIDAPRLTQFFVDCPLLEKWTPVQQPIGLKKFEMTAHWFSGLDLRFTEHLRQCKLVSVGLETVQFSQSPTLSELELVTPCLKQLEIPAMNPRTELKSLTWAKEMSADLSSLIKNCKPQPTQPPFSFFDHRADDLNYLIDLGHCFIEQDKIELAIACYEGIIKINKTDVKHFLILSELCAQLGRDKRAMTHLKEADGLHPNTFDIHYSIGSIFYRQQNYTNALTHFIRAQELAPQKGGCHFWTGRTYRQLGDLNNASLAFCRALENGENSADCYFDYGDCKLELGEKENAKTLFKKGLQYKNDPSSVLKLAEINHELGLAALKAGKIDNGIALLEDAITIDPKRKSAIYPVLANIYIQKAEKWISTQQFDHAKQELNLAKEYVDHNETTHTIKGKYCYLNGCVHRKNKQFRDAIDSLKEAVQYSENSALYWFTLAEVYDQTHLTWSSNYPEIDAAKKAVSLNNEMMEAHRLLVNVYSRAGMSDKAAAQLMIVIQRAPIPNDYCELLKHYPHPAKYLEFIHFAKDALRRFPKEPSLKNLFLTVAKSGLAHKQFDSVLAFIRCLEFVPATSTDADAFYGYANLLRAHNEPSDLVRSACRRAIELNPNDARYHHLIGLTCESSNGKIQAYLRATELSPTSADYHACLADAYFQKGKNKEAVNAIIVAVGLNPDCKEYTNKLNTYKLGGGR